MKNLGFKIYLANFWFVSSSFASFIPRKLLPARTFWQNASTYFNCLAPRDCHSLGDWLPDCRSVCLSLTESGSISGYFYYLRFFIWDSATCSLLRFRLNQRQFLHLHLHDGDTSFSLSIFFFFCLDFLANAFILCTCISVSIYVSGGCRCCTLYEQRPLDRLSANFSKRNLFVICNSQFAWTDRASDRRCCRRSLASLPSEILWVIHLHFVAVRAEMRCGMQPRHCNTAAARLPLGYFRFVRRCAKNVSNVFNQK